MWVRGDLPGECSLQLHRRMLSWALYHCADVLNAIAPYQRFSAWCRWRIGTGACLLALSGAAAGATTDSHT